MQDEGYIKFHAQLTRKPPMPWEELEELSRYRQEMYDLQLIGAYENGIGYGNISRRWDETNRFIISGSATGGIEYLSDEHYALVTAVDLKKNVLQCEGPIIASSESMSHAVIYRQCPEVYGVIHVHHAGLWQELLHQVPTTDKEATYGTPEMAYSIMELLKKTDLRKRKLFVMEGHPEGVFAFGETLEEAAQKIREVL